MSGSTAGARWLAREQFEIGAATDTLGEGGDPAVITHEPPHTFPLVDCMSERALLAFAAICAEYGVGIERAA